MGDLTPRLRLYRACTVYRVPCTAAPLVLIAALAAFLLFMIGAAAERMNLQHGMHASSSKRRVYSLPFLAMLILNITKSEIDASEFLSPDEVIAQFHRALLAD